MKKLTLCFLMLPIPVMAITGNEFNTLPYGEKGAYIVGIDDGLAFMGASCTQSGPKTYEETLNVVIQFMEKHPERLTKSMAELYAEAVINAFDCEKNPKAL